MSEQNISIALGNRETMLNEIIEIALQQTYKDINFQLETASRVAGFIQLAARPEIRLAIFIPPFNLLPDPSSPAATAIEEAVSIIKSIKVRNPLPIIVMAVQCDARKTLLAAGADVFLDIPAQPQQVVDAVAKCLGLEPKLIISQ